MILVVVLGAVAQLVAHLHGMQGVRGSSPLSSTRGRARSSDRALSLSRALRRARYVVAHALPRSGRGVVAGVRVVGAWASGKSGRPARGRWDACARVLEVAGCPAWGGSDLREVPDKSGGRAARPGADGRTRATDLSAGAEGGVDLRGVIS